MSPVWACRAPSPRLDGRVLACVCTVADGRMGQLDAICPAIAGSVRLLT
ncbi:hypothetical protein [Komagataeibacter diospyri]|nr:hypothetical protein [Komagataeibacter diospyri]